MSLILKVPVETGERAVLGALVLEELGTLIDSNLFILIFFRNFLEIVFDRKRFLDSCNSAKK